MCIVIGGRSIKRINICMYVDFFSGRKKFDPNSIDRYSKTVAVSSSIGNVCWLENNSLKV